MPAEFNVSLFPIFLKLHGRRCLVVGAGEIARSKVHSLWKAGARLIVVAPEALPDIAALAEQGHIEWVRREFIESDLNDMFLVVAATNIAAVNQAVYRAAVERDILCNAVDDPPHCDFYFPSVVGRGELQIAISTAGESPALAQRLRREIDEQLPDDLGPWLADLGQLRRDVLTAYPAGDARKMLLHRLAQRTVCDSSTCPIHHLKHESKP